MSIRNYLLPAAWVGTLRAKRPCRSDIVVPFPEERMKPSHVSAFTLLELIIAISIGTALIMLVSFAVRTGFFQMERGSKWLEEGHRDDSALSFLRQQITSMRHELINKEVIFNGDAGNIVFVTPISLERSYGLGLMMANYYIEDDGGSLRLNYREKRFVPGEDLDRFKDQYALMLSDSDVVEIVNGYDQISFYYLGLKDDKDAASSKPVSEWENEWTANSLPKAIKVVLTRDGQVQELIAPVMVMY